MPAIRLDRDRFLAITTSVLRILPCGAFSQVVSPMCRILTSRPEFGKQIVQLRIAVNQQQLLDRRRPVDLQPSIRLTSGL
ncbi:hypothetical protein ebA2908 [Aromatoleum aromaticum EbN1]|uniref:Uncharacterized protein n=1 Tax=Aromatoleum aromaticum (strain DSM 19018 / LMG 30748 / EbN1) TaxID=76114 RepID=Q5P4K1_AROAE|nr:hypothetical protein ebA2908 [Aromatoleum aromaticum EbN1]